MWVYLGSSELSSYYQWQGGGWSIYLGSCCIWPTNRYVPYVINDCTIYYNNLRQNNCCYGACGTSFICTLCCQALVNGNNTWWMYDGYMCFGIYCDNACIPTFSFRAYFPEYPSLCYLYLLWGTWYRCAYRCCWNLTQRVSACKAGANYFFVVNNRCWPQTSAWRHNVVRVNDAFYIDAQYCVGIKPCNAGSICPFFKVHWWCGYRIADLIVERKPRTSDEVQAYYNNSKARFWL